MFVLRVLAAYCCLGMSLGLKCFTCEDVEFSSDSSFIKDHIGDFKSNKACSSTKFNMLDNNVGAKECPAGEVCGLVKGDFSGKVAGLFDLDAKFYVRDCVPYTGHLDGCFTDSDAGKVLSRSLTFIGKISGLTVNADRCTCDTPLCIAGGCASDEWAIGPLCMQKWLVGVIAGGALVLIIALITCCCCCCCCRKNPAPQAIIVTQVPAPVAHMQHTAAGYSQFDNMSTPTKIV